MVTSIRARQRLNKRLLGMLVADPQNMLVLAISTGMAVAHEMMQREHAAELDTLAYSETLCTRACEAVLELWVERSKAGSVTEADFDALCARITRIARAS